MQMTKTAVCLLAVAALTACARQKDLNELPTGTDVAVETRDGGIVAGSLAEASDDRVVVTRRDGGRTTINRADVKAVAVDPPKTADRADANSGAGDVPAWREITVPKDTALEIALESSLASDTSRVEDRVEAVLERPLMVDGIEAAPAGSRLVGSVTEARPSGKVKGRARLAFRFDTLVLADGKQRLDISARPIVIEAQATKAEDAKKIGIPAAAGAVIGGILGGGDGAAKGAAIGGGAGTAVVLATAGDEVRLPAGHRTRVRLDAPLTLQVPASRASA